MGLKTQLLCGINLKEKMQGLGAGWVPGFSCYLVYMQDCSDAWDLIRAYNFFDRCWGLERQNLKRGPNLLQRQRVRKLSITTLGSFLCIWILKKFCSLTRKLWSVGGKAFALWKSYTSLSFLSDENTLALPVPVESDGESDSSDRIPVPSFQNSFSQAIEAALLKLDKPSTADHLSGEEASRNPEVRKNEYFSFWEK